MDEIKFYGRGGQGVVMASQMLGFAFFKAGFYPQ
jgi:Pyruvate/2-oxoacid:ferredoxin oxidoreductase gamma subunit